MAKKTKEQLEAERIAEEERLAAVSYDLDVVFKLFAESTEAKAEEDRKAAAAAEAARLEAERVRLRGEEVERLAAETITVVKSREIRERALLSLLDDAADKDEWRRFLDFIQAVDVKDAQVMNTFLSSARDEVTDGTSVQLAAPAALGIAPAGAGGLIRQNSNRTSLDAFAPVSGPPAGPPASAITPSLALCTRLATAASALEHRLADECGAGDDDGNGCDARAADDFRSQISAVRKLLMQRIDIATQAVLEANQEYGVEVKDGLREVVVMDRVTSLPTAEESRRRGQDVAARKQSLMGPGQREEPAAEVLLWASVPPGKVTRSKVISNAAVAGPGRVTFSAELHKSIAAAGNPSALRLTWTSYDDSADIDAVLAEREAKEDAAWAGIWPRESTDRKKAVGGSAKARPKSGREGSVPPRSRPVSAVVKQQDQQEEAKAEDADGKEQEEGKEEAEGGAAAAPVAAEGIVDAPADGQADGGQVEPPAAADAAPPDNAEAAAAQAAPPSPAAIAASRASSGAPGRRSPTESQLYPISGVLHIDLLEMPRQATIVKGWAMQRSMNVNGPQSTSTVRRLPHPLIGQGVSAAAGQAVKVKFTLPSTTIIPPGEPRVARWSATGGDGDGRGGWTPADVMDVQLEPASRVLSFSTVHMAPHALCQPPTVDLPYSSWSTVPSAPSSAPSVTLNLTTTRLVVSIEASTAGCRLLGPSIPELADLLPTHPSPLPPMPPGRLLTELKRRGLNLMPSDADAGVVQSSSGVRPKDRGMEMRAYGDLAELACAFELAPSHWNQHALVDNHNAVLRARESTTGSNTGPATWHADPTAWRCIRYVSDTEVPAGYRVMAVTDTEADAHGKDVPVAPPPAAPDADSESKGEDGVVAAASSPTPRMEHVSIPFRGEVEAGGETHVAVRLVLAPRASPRALKDIDACPPLLVKTVERLLKLTRPLSFAAGAAR